MNQVNYSESPSISTLKVGPVPLNDDEGLQYLKICAKARLENFQMILCRSCADILMVDIMKDHAKSKTIWQKKLPKSHLH